MSSLPKSDDGDAHELRDADMPHTSAVHDLLDLSIGWQ